MRPGPEGAARRYVAQVALGRFKADSIAPTSAGSAWFHQKRWWKTVQRFQGWDCSRAAPSLEGAGGLPVWQATFRLCRRTPGSLTVPAVVCVVGLPSELFPLTPPPHEPQRERDGPPSLSLSPQRGRGCRRPERGWFRGSKHEQVREILSLRENEPRGPHGRVPGVLRLGSSLFSVEWLVYRKPLGQRVLAFCGAALGFSEPVEGSQG